MGMRDDEAEASTIPVKQRTRPAAMITDPQLLPRLASSLACLLLLMSSASGASPNFQDHILPILKKHCLSCHNVDDAEADLDLSTFAGIERGSSGGKVVVAGSPNRSSLFLAVDHDENSAAMPPDSPKIPADQIKQISDWIAGGLLASVTGKSQLREVSFSVSTGSLKRPEEPAFPFALNDVAITPTNVTPPVVAMAASPWANVVAANGYRQVLLYGSTDEKDPEWPYIGSLPFPEGDIHDLRFSRNGELLIAAGGIGAQSGRVAVFDVATGKRVATLADEYDIVLSADISSDHKYVAIGTPSRLVKIFSTDDGQLLHRIKKHTDWVTVVRFSPDGQQLASADRNGGIHLWETANAGIVYTLDEHKSKVTSLSWRADGKFLASASEDGKFILWDMKDGWATRSINGHVEKSDNRYTRRTGVLDISFATDGRLLTVGRDRRVRLWNLDGQRTSQSDQLTSIPLQSQFLSNGNLIAVGSFGGGLTILDAPTLKPKANLDLP